MYPIHLSLSLLLLIMCIDVPVSSGLFSKWVPASPLIKLSFVRILELLNIFASSHASLRAHLSWCKVSSCDISLDLGAQLLRS